jgi:serine protease DegQ
MRSRSDLAKLAAALNGLPVLGCLSGSPAAVAGVRYGDILLSIDGQATSNWDEFLTIRSGVKGGFTARIFRDGEELDMRIELREGPSPAGLELLAELAAMH